MAKQEKCGLCGRAVIERILFNGKMICKGCYNGIQDESIANEVSLDLPQNVVWIGKVAKMGNARAFFIPKSQRAFLKLHQDYFIIIKEVVLEAKT